MKNFLQNQFQSWVNPRLLKAVPFSLSLTLVLIASVHHPAAAQTKRTLPPMNITGTKPAPAEQRTPSRPAGLQVSATGASGGSLTQDQYTKLTNAILSINKRLTAIEAKKTTAPAASQPSTPGYMNYRNEINTLKTENAGLKQQVEQLKTQAAENRTTINDLVTKFSSVGFGTRGLERLPETAPAP